MGTPVPPFEPVPPGETCSVCWGAGKPFGVGPTPSEVRVMITGIEKGPDWEIGFGEPPAGSFDLTQTFGVPCGWTFENPEFIMQLIVGPLFSQFQVTQRPSLELSFFAQGLECGILFENELTDNFKEGVVEVTILPTT